MKACCLAVLVVTIAGCSSRPTEWREILGGDNLLRVGTGVWGSAHDDLYVVGGQVSGGSPLALHYDGKRWSSVDTGGASEGYRWVWGSGPGDVYFLGQAGAIDHLSGDTVERDVAATDLTLFGAWGAEARDVWAVGGDPSSSVPQVVMLRNQGFGWSNDTPSFALAGTLFAVWGAAADDVWAVGDVGTIIHWNGDEWAPVTSGTSEPLRAIAGTATDDVWAVGGDPGVVLHWDGSAWSEVNTGLAPPALDGVSALAGTDVIVVGAGGTRLRLADGEWTDESDSPALPELFAVWTAPTDDGDEVIAAGGSLPTGGPPAGSIAHYGDNIPSRTLE